MTPGQVVLFRDLRGLLDEHPGHGHAVRAGLVCYEPVAQQVARNARSLLR